MKNIDIETKQTSLHLVNRFVNEITPKMLGEGVNFERTRRITGYLVGTLDRFNNAKRSEERDRVKHGVTK